MKPIDNAGLEPLLRPIRDAIAQLKAVPFMSGQKHTTTLVQGTWVQIPHRLGRGWAGYEQTALLNDCGAGWHWAKHTPQDDKFLYLMAKGYTANPVLELWIY